MDLHNTYFDCFLISLETFEDRRKQYEHLLNAMQIHETLRAQFVDEYLGIVVGTSTATPLAIQVVTLLGLELIMSSWSICLHNSTLPLGATI